MTVVIAETFDDHGRVLQARTVADAQVKVKRHYGAPETTPCAADIVQSFSDLQEKALRNPSKAELADSQRNRTLRRSQCAQEAKPCRPNLGASVQCRMTMVVAKAKFQMS